MTAKKKSDLPRTPKPLPALEDVIVTLPENKAQLAKIRHELRTPINHIIGYGEIVEEDLLDMGQLIYLDDVKRIQSAGRQLLALVSEIFSNADGPARRLDVRQSLPDLRTPINHVVGYSEMLLEQAEEAGLHTLVADFQKIAHAGRSLLALLENFLLTPAGLDAAEPPDSSRPAQAGQTEHLIRAAPPAILADILIVDDDPENREMLGRRILRLGYTVYSAENGEKALEAMRARKFDLVLLDYLMPGMDGSQVLMEIKGDERLRNIPVIMLSALDVMDRIVECIDAGAEDYVAKPFNPVFLKSRIGAVLEKKRMRDLEQIYLQRIQAERQKSERLLLNVLPAPIAARLKNGENAIADSFPEATVVFADLVGFTSLSMHISADEVVRLLDEIFSAFDLLTEKFGLEKIKTIGDAYMAASGLPSPNPGHVHSAADFCLAMMKEMERFNRGYHTNIALRVGIHTGPVIAGIIGRNKFIYDLWGDTVNTASRMESHSLPGRVQATANIHAALRDEFEFEKRGAIEVKGKGLMETFFLTGRAKAKRSKKPAKEPNSAEGPESNPQEPQKIA